MLILLQLAFRSLLLTICCIVAFAAESAVADVVMEQPMVWIDASRSLEFDNVRSLERIGQGRWMTSGQSNYGYSNSRYWVKFRIHASQGPGNGILEYAYPLIQKLEIFFVTQTGEVDHFNTGRLRPFASRPIEYMRFAFPFSLNAKQDLWVYAKIESNGAVSLPFSVASEKDFNSRARREYLGLGLYYGIIFVMIAYNLFLFFSIRDRGYLYYVLFTFGVAACQSCINGLGFEFVWSNSIWWNNVSLVFFVGFTLFFLCLFTQNFLQTYKHTPKLHYSLRCMMFASAGLSILALVHHGPMAVRLTGLLAVIAPLVVLPTAILSVLQGSRPAVYFLASMSAFLLGTTAYGLKDFGVLPAVFLTNYGIQIGSAMEVVLLSLGLADRINILSKQKVDSDRESRDAHQRLELAHREAKAQRTIAELYSQVAHDIRSPLAALNILEQDLVCIEEDKRVLLRSSISRIRDIANNLLQKNRAVSEKTGVSPENAGLKEASSVQILSSLIESIISEKRLQYRAKSGIVIEGRLTAASYGLFACVQPAEFKRVISNLINNAVEGLGDAGEVFVVVSEFPEGTILIRVVDNGHGIPADVLARLGARGETYGKEGGSGLGLYHARKNVEFWGGNLKIESSVGVGTTVVITLPKAEVPDWFVSKLELKPNQAIAILDDDDSVHRLWKGWYDSKRLGESGVKIRNFYTPGDFSAWVTSSPEAATAIYLADYELLGFEETGLSLIEKYALGPNAILVTSRFEEPLIQSQCRRLGVKLMPKGLPLVESIG